MRPFDPEGLTEGTEHRNDCRQVVVEALRQRGRGAETGQVDGNDVAFGSEDVEDRLPRLPVVTDAVEQQQRLTRTPAFVRQGHGPRTARGFDRERDLLGHTLDSLT